VISYIFGWLVDYIVIRKNYHVMVQARSVVGYQWQGMSVVNFPKGGKMKRAKFYFKMLLIVFLCLLYNASLGDTGSSNSSTTGVLGSYKTLKIHAGLEYTLKYKKPAKGNPVDMVYEFVELNKSLIPITYPRNELIPTYQAFDKTSGVISFQQVYHGIPIQYSDITARFTPSGELKNVEGEYHYDINLSTNYSVDSLSASQRALVDVGVESAPHPGVICPSKPVITHSSEFERQDENRLYLVWPVQVFPDTTGLTSRGNTDYYAYYIDALDGSIVYKQKRTTMEF